MLVTVLLDVMGIGIIIPVLPALVGEFTGSRDSLAFWYGVLGAAYGLMQFLVAPVLGALSDQFGRRKRAGRGEGLKRGEQVGLESEGGLIGRRFVHARSSATS